MLDVFPSVRRGVGYDTSRHGGGQGHTTHAPPCVKKKKCTGESGGHGRIDKKTTLDRPHSRPPTYNNIYIIYIAEDTVAAPCDLPQARNCWHEQANKRTSEQANDCSPQHEKRPPPDAPPGVLTRRFWRRAQPAGNRASDTKAAARCRPLPPAAAAAAWCATGLACNRRRHTPAPTFVTKPKTSRREGGTNVVAAASFERGIAPGELYINILSPRRI